MQESAEPALKLRIRIAIPDLNSILNLNSPAFTSCGVNDSICPAVDNIASDTFLLPVVLPVATSLDVTTNLSENLTSLPDFSSNACNKKRLFFL